MEDKDISLALRAVCRCDEVESARIAEAAAPSRH